MNASIDAVAAESCYPPTPMQSGMLFHSLYSPRSGLYIEQIVCDLREAVEAAVLERAWHRVIQRHAVLRTCFRIDGLDKPFQQVLPSLNLPLPCEQYDGLSPGEQNARFEAFLQSDLSHDFDPSRPPLMRLALFRLEATHYRLLWTYHHALLDGRSSRIVLRDVFDYYDAFLNGQDMHRSPPRPYSDYVAWLSQQDFAESKQFWRQSLKGVSQTPLVGAQPVHNGDSKTLGRSTLELQVSETTADALQAVARENQLTMNTLIQGAWAQLLSRYADEEEVVFGATRSLRGPAFEGIREMVGLFINTVPMRVAVPPDMGLLAWLNMLRSQWIAMRPFERAPLTDILQWSETRSGMSLLSSIVVFEYSTLNAALTSELKNADRREFKHWSSTNYPLTLAASAEPHLILKIGYERSRFQDATIRRMLGHLQRLLETLACDLDKPLKCRSILTAPERHQLLIEWQKTERAFPEADCVHRLFEKQVQRSPDAVAVLCEDLALTYRELNERSNQLAHHLQRLGVGAETLVGICLYRSPDVIVAIMAIHKAGGAYLPLDAAYPQQRLKTMIDDAQLPVIITVDELAARLPESGAKIICVDRHGDQIAREDATNPDSATSLESLAYAVFTSGSTGQPKGVLNPHRALTNHTLALIEKYDISASDRRLQFVSLSSDVLIAEIFPYLATGAAIVLRPKSDFPSVADFLQFLEEQKITVVGAPSALWHEWVLLLSWQDLPFPSSLRLVVAGMDRVRPDLFAIWKAKVGNRARWVNAYGPSEATCTTTTYEADLSSDETLASVPIGRPITNAKVYLLDAQQDPVPIGVPGELYIGGHGVARGYLNHPTSTAKKFIPNPFSDDPQDRLYKTGDLARYRDDGNIEFLGRLDHQVKLRGYRIELGEVEAALASHPAVHECAAMLREDRPGDARLAVYYVARCDVQTASLRDYLKTKLPEYMLPSAYVGLESLPLTSSRKIDRQSLPAPADVDLESSAHYVAPRNAMEQQLASLWAELLNLDRVGIHDNFFDLGGHSLLAVRLCARLEQIVRRKLPVAALFVHKTVGELAGLLESSPTDAPLVSVIPLQRASGEHPLFLMPGIGGEVMHARPLLRHLGLELPVYGLQPELSAEAVAHFVDFEATAARYLAAIRKCQPRGPYRLAGHSYGGMLAYEVARQMAEMRCQVDLLAVIDTGPGYHGTRDQRHLLRRLGAFAANLPYWLVDDALRESPRELSRRFRRKLRLILRRARAWLSGISPGDVPVEFDEVFDFDRVLTQNHELMATLYRAFRDYVPKAYPGRVTLFRARTRPLFGSAPADLGWRRLALGGVEIHWLPGHHTSIMNEPLARNLAAKIKACLMGSAKVS